MNDVAERETVEVPLPGCRPEPLASYLKALAVLRLVAEQKDPEARGAWQGEQFVLTSTLNREALVRFFTEEWRPTPVVAPWNGGSGFWPSTSDEALRAIENSTEPRLRAYAQTIAVARTAIASLNLSEAPEKGEFKTQLLTYLRASFDDAALAWLDAACVLTDDDPAYPALLGTGGNDGRQDFSNNFMQRLLTVLAEPRSVGAALFGEPHKKSSRGSMGQFSPAELGRSNPWDFVLSVEGAMVLAGAATRRLESADPSTLAFPFHTRSSIASSVASGEDGHGELWLPLWNGAATFRDVRQLFAEGRAKAGRPAATSTGLDFARSIASLGTDRGVSSFVRVSFQPRNGKNYFATPLGRFSTKQVPSARLMDDLDARSWSERFMQKSGKSAPVGVAHARRQLELAMFEAAQTGILGPVLLALGDAELALSLSLGFTTKAFLRPVPRLQSAWSAEVADGSVEQRLASALAGRPGIRSRLIPIERGTGSFGRVDDAEYVFRRRPLIENLLALLRREDIESQQRDAGVPREPSVARCSLTDLADFVAGRTDDVLLERWLRALVLVEGLDLGRVPADGQLPPAAFAVVALVHHRRLREEELPRTTGVLARASAGDALGATEAAIRRLSASGCPLPVDRMVEPNVSMRRIAAALAFPLTTYQRRKLESMVLPAADKLHETPEQPVKESA